MHFNPDQSDKNQNRRGSGSPPAGNQGETSPPSGSSSSPLPGGLGFGADGAPQPIPLNQLPPEIRKQVLEQLGGTADIPSESLPSSQPELFQFVRDINRSIDYKETIYNIANEARTVTGVGRVSVVRFYRGKFRIECISGQPSVNRRSNEIRLLTSLADKTLRTGQPFAYPPAHQNEYSLEPDSQDQTIPEGFPSPEEFQPKPTTSASTDVSIPNSGPGNEEENEDQSSDTAAGSTSESSSQLPPEIKNPLREYLGKGKARSVLIVPISEAETEVKRQIEDPSKTKKRRKRSWGV